MPWNVDTDHVRGYTKHSKTFDGEVNLGPWLDTSAEMFNEEDLTDFRYYMGRILGFIITPNKKKALFEYLEDGKVGNKAQGYKYVKAGEQDIVPMRMLRRNKRCK